MFFDEQKFLFMYVFMDSFVYTFIQQTFIECWSTLENKTKSSPLLNSPIGEDKQ